MKVMRQRGLARGVLRFVAWSRTLREQVHPAGELRGGAGPCRVGGVAGDKGLGSGKGGLGLVQASGWKGRRAR